MSDFVKVEADALASAVETLVHCAADKCRTRQGR